MVYPSPCLRPCSDLDLPLWNEEVIWQLCKQPVFTLVFLSCDAIPAQSAKTHRGSVIWCPTTKCLLNATTNYIHFAVPLPRRRLCCFNFVPFPERFSMTGMIAGRINTQEFFSEYDEDEERLVIDLFREYNSLIRPVQNVSSPPVTVDFGVAMILLINVDEKNQILQTNVWLTMKWNEFSTNEAPEDSETSQIFMSLPIAFGYRTLCSSTMRTAIMRCPSDRTRSSNQTVTSHGCLQRCSKAVVALMSNGSHLMNKVVRSYSGHGHVPGYLVNKRDTKESKIVFHVVIRRKTLFYTVILIIPTVLMAFLSMMAFYLPADSAEKISLTINLLLALVVFYLPLRIFHSWASISSLAFVLNITTVVVTVVIVNVYFRSAISHEMPDYVRHIFLDFLPRVLMMKRPERIPIFNGYFVEEYSASEIFDASLIMPSVTATMVPFLRVGTPVVSQEPMIDEEDHHQNCSKWRKISKKLSLKRKRNERVQESCLGDQNANKETHAARISREMKTTVEAIAYIAEHMKGEMNDK
ncbi:Neurotransmitter-gated ion-channel transmembrane region, partial [Ostertagia ostertagi]